jgi:hypothetical protein
LIVTLVLDSCHSGGATRGVGTATARGMIPGPAGFDTREPPADSAVASLEELTNTWTGLSRSLARTATQIGGWLSESRGYTLLAACRANEFAYEDFFDGKKNGALTYWLLDSLRSMPPNTSYKDLHDRLLAKIRSWMESQTPQLEGEGDILVFGTDRITPVYAIPILEVDAAGKRVKPNAGEVHGLSVGTRQLKRDDPNVESIEHRQTKYLNNRLEADHGPIKRLCRATLGFKSMKAAYATIKGFEVMRMIRKRQCILLEPGVRGEVRFVAKLLGVPAC